MTQSPPQKDPRCRSVHRSAGGCHGDLRGRTRPRNPEDGVGPLPLNLADGGGRVSTADTYLDPARRRANLTVLAGCLVDWVLFEGTRASALPRSTTDASVSRSAPPSRAASRVRADSSLSWWAVASGLCPMTTILPSEGALAASSSATPSCPRPVGGDGQ
ncbi:GMC family oxidoreductase N-terminal domain-containing protein [Streptomyces netropsis]